GEERPVLAEDHVWVDVVQVPKHAQQGDLTAGEARDVIEVDDPQALVSRAGGEAVVELAMACAHRGPVESLGMAPGGRASRQLSPRCALQPPAQRFGVSGCHHPPASLTMLGVPHAAASSTTRPKPSNATDGTTATSAAR